MNIVKLQQQLQNVGDNDLVGYVQNPTGQVPSYLALTELNRRKTIRADYQAQSAPEQSVAEEMTQGVAGLPVPDQMFTAPETGIASTPQPEMQSQPEMQPQGMAAGGEVKSFAGGGGVNDITQEQFARLTPSQQDQYYNVFRNQQTAGNIWSGLQTPGSAIAQQGSNLYTGARNYVQPIRKMIGQDSPTAGPETAQNTMPTFGKVNSMEEYIATLPSESKAPSADLSRQNKTAAFLADQAQQDLSNPNFPPSMQGTPRTDNTQSTTTARSGGIGGGGGGVRPTGGIGSISYTPFSTDEAGYNSLMPENKSMQEYASEFNKELGDDPSRAAMRERLSKMQTEDDLDSRRAPWMALAEAGFGMAAGESQFALQNVGKGASQGIKSFIAARGNVRKAEERRFELENKLGQAERSEQIAGITYGMESKRADDARKTTVGLAQQTDKARTAEVNAKGVYDAKKDNLTFAQKETEMRLNSADNAARIASLDRNVTRQIKSAENTAVRDDLKFRLGLFKSTLTEVNTAITEARKAFPPDEALIKDLQQQFNSTFTAMSALANQGGDNTGSGAAANMRSYFTK